MPSAISFASNEGLETINSIVKKLIPKWKDGLRLIQRDSIPKILNLEDVFAIDATGGGKSALFGVPILVHQEISQNPSVYPIFNVSIRPKPVGVVVTPTKGLASNIVCIL
jgi:superfamily II DNA/RNA helicase